MTGPSISAVIPVCNRADLLAGLLDTAADQTLPFHEVIVVDNASTDGAGDVARARGHKVIRNSSNLGFARAVNAGWRAASGEWIAILNSDVTLDPAWADRLVAAAGKASFAAGTILRADGSGTIDGSYDLMAQSGCAWRAGNGAVASAVGTSPIEVGIVPATACMYRRSVLEQLGGFDESFVSYLEDVDLGLRCVREGLTGVFVPIALAWHKGSATFGEWDPRVVRAISRNQLRIVERHFDPTLYRDCRWRVFVGQALWGLLAVRHGAGLAWLSGKLEGLRDFRPGAPPSERIRRFLQASEREVRTRATDAYWRWYFRLTSGTNGAN